MKMRCRDSPIAVCAVSDMLVTGATGFVGDRLLQRLITEDAHVRAVSRTLPQKGGPPAEWASVASIDNDTDWREVLRGVQAVAHLAARVHIMRDRVADPLSAFRRVNVDGTLNLARQAAEAGVRRFIYVSSIKVNGESTRGDCAFSPDQAAAPSDAYGISKYEAECGLRELGSASGMEVTVIRPVLVYGPGVRANFLAMMKLLSRGIPLPLGAVRNCRSLVALDNLVDLIVTCAKHPLAANQVFLVSDDEDMSTGELLMRLGKAMNSPARLFPIPTHLLTAAAALVGRQDAMR